MAYSMDQFNEELMHYGVLGMKWGIRRYQNPDGSLTKAGMRRYQDKSPYEVTTSDGDTFRVSKGSKNNYNTKVSKVTKTWGQHYREIDDAKAKKRISKQYARAVARQGDKMLDSYARKTKVSKISTKHVTTGKANKAYKKLWSVKIKDLQKQYGMLEDQMTYGKNADPVKNSRIESQMNGIEEQLRKHRG